MLREHLTDMRGADAIDRLISQRLHPILVQQLPVGFMRRELYVTLVYKLLRDNVQRRVLRILEGPWINPLSSVPSGPTAFETSRQEREFLRKSSASLRGAYTRAAMLRFAT